MVAEEGMKSISSYGPERPCPKLLFVYYCLFYYIPLYSICLLLSVLLYCFIIYVLVSVMMP